MFLQETETNVTASYEQSQIIAENARPYNEGECIKQCILKTVNCLFIQQNPFKQKYGCREDS